MDIPKVNILESYAGQDAINWVKAHTITPSTFSNNEELLYQAIQFHQNLTMGRASLHLPDRLDWISPTTRPSQISFEINNVAEVTVFEYPELEGSELEVTVGFRNGTELCIVLNRRGKIVQLRADLDRPRE